MSKITFDDFPAMICFWKETVQVKEQGGGDWQLTRYWASKMRQPDVFDPRIFERSINVTDAYDGIKNWEEALQLLWTRRSIFGIK